MGGGESNVRHHARQNRLQVVSDCWGSVCGYYNIGHGVDKSGGGASGGDLASGGRRSLFARSRKMTCQACLLGGAGLEKSGQIDRTQCALEAQFLCDSFV